MKLNSLEPNASYDLVNGKPSIFKKDNDGSFIYRYNIEPEMGINEGEIEEIQIGWKCREIRIWTQLTKSELKKAIIRSIIDDTKELDIINAYNKHIIGIKIDDTAVDTYKEFLQLIEDLDAMLISDFQLNELT